MLHLTVEGEGTVLYEHTHLSSLPNGVANK